MTGQFSWAPEPIPGPDGTKHGDPDQQAQANREAADTAAVIRMGERATAQEAKRPKA